MYLVPTILLPVGTLLCRITDHFPCLFAMDIAVDRLDFPLRFTLRDLDEGSLSKINDKLRDSALILNDQSVDVGFEYLINKIQEIYFTICPLREVKIPRNRVIRDKWMTSSLLRRSQNLRKVFSAVCRMPRDSDEYKDYVKQRNLLNADKRRLKNSFFW